MTQGSTPPGWYDDGHGAQRWFDGQQWTDQTQPASPPAGPPSTPPQGGYPSQGGYPPQPGWGPPPSSGGGMGKGLLWSLIGGGVVLVGAVVVVLVLVLSGGDDDDDNADEKGGGGGGGGGGIASPADVTTEYIEAVSSSQYERVCEIVAEADVQRDFERFEVTDCAGLGDAYDEQIDSSGFGEYARDITADVTIGDTEEDGDTATVDYSATYRYDGDDPEGFQEATSAEELEMTEDGTMQLVKEDGEWKVDATASAQASSGGGAAEDAPVPEPSAVTPS